MYIFYLTIFHAKLYSVLVLCSDKGKPGWFMRSREQRLAQVVVNQFTDNKPDCKTAFQILCDYVTMDILLCDCASVQPVKITGHQGHVP